MLTQFIAFAIQLTSPASDNGEETERVAPGRENIRTNASGELYLDDDAGRTIRLYCFREVLDLARINAMTYYTWVKRGVVQDARLRDRGKWRVFTEGELRRVLAIAREQGFDVPYQAGMKTTESRDTYHGNWRESP